MSACASFKVKDSEDVGRLSVAQDILRTSTDFLRRIIALIFLIFLLLFFSETFFLFFPFFSFFIQIFSIF